MSRITHTSLSLEELVRDAQVIAVGKFTENSEELSPTDRERHGGPAYQRTVFHFQVSEVLKGPKSLPQPLRVLQADWSQREKQEEFGRRGGGVSYAVGVYERETELGAERILFLVEDEGGYYRYAARDAEESLSKRKQIAALIG